MPIVTRMIEAEEYGTIATAVRVGQVVAVIAAFGLPAALARIYFDDDGADRARRLGVSATVASVLVVTLVHATGSWWSQLFRGLDYGAPLMIVVWGAIPIVLFEASQGLLRAREDVAGFVTWVLVGSVGGQVLGLAALVLTDGGAAQYLGGLMIGMACGALGAAWRAGMLGAKPAPWSVVAPALRLGGPTVPHLLAFLVLAVGDRVVIERALGLAEVARYEVAYQVGMLGIVAVAAINNAWAPMVYGSPSETRWQLLADTSASISSVLAPLVGAIALMSPLALALMAPESYDTAELVQICSVLTVTAMLYLRYVANVLVVFQQRKTVVLAWSTPMAATVNIGLCLALVERWGLLGCAVATVASYALLAFLVGRTAGREAEVPWLRQAEWRALALAATVAGAAALVPTTGIWVVVRGITAAGLVALAAWDVRRVVRWEQ